MFVSKTPLVVILRRSTRLVFATIQTTPQFPTQPRQTHCVRSISAMGTEENESTRHRRRQPLQPPLLQRRFSPTFLVADDAVGRSGSVRGLCSTATRLKAIKPPVTDMRDTDIDIDLDEIEFVGRKLRRFQIETTGESDPLPSEIEPSPLHLVTLTRSYGGNIWWLKKILWEFGMYSHPTTKIFPEYQKAIVPNTPENNKKLAKIKHCVRIDRVTFPYGYPETEADLKHMRISDHGEVTFVKEVVSHVLDDGTVATNPLGVPRESLPEEMDEETIKIDCYRKLRNREFLDEYHPEYDNRKLGQGHFKGMKVYWDKDKAPIVY